MMPSIALRCQKRRLRYELARGRAQAIAIYFLAVNIYTLRIMVYLTALLVVVVIVLIGLWIWRRRKMTQGMTDDESLRLLAKLSNMTSKENNSAMEKPFIGHESGVYDPIQMGALKQSEVDSHNRSLREMMPFSYLGPAAPAKVIRDDDDFLRNTGVPWVGTGSNLTAVRGVMSGPQAAARQLTSTSEKDIAITHFKAATSPSWGGIVGTY